MDTVKNSNSAKDLTIIGNNALVTIAGIKNIPAKVDTGADSSALWASDIQINAHNQLEFCLFAPGYELYTGEKITADTYTVKQVRNSTGDVSVRYRVPIQLRIENRLIRANFTLTDRSQNRFPVLIGRKTLQNKFLVDVSKVSVPRPSTFDNTSLNDELRKNPQKFHAKYMQKPTNAFNAAPSTPETPLTPVRAYYYQHFDELSPEKQFHFATRIKNYFKTNDFDNYLAHHIPSSDLLPILKDNDFSQITNAAAARKPYFEKYPQLYGIEAALFRVNHLLNEYNIDLRPQLIEHLPLDHLYQLSDTLLADDGAIATLSTWAVNTIALTEYLFPRHQNTTKVLAEKALQIDPTTADPVLLIYLYTHIILCDSSFYTRPITEKTLAKKMLNRAAKIIEQHFDELILDVRIEFLVCANMAGIDYPELRQRIAAECQQILSTSDYLKDPRRPESRHTLEAAEHTNVLFIMSGLDDTLNTAKP